MNIKIMIHKIKSFIKQNAIIFSLLFLIFIFPYSCPIRFFTGISCFSCGLTRATIALLHLDFKNAFIYHPMIFLLPFGVLWYGYKKWKKKKVNNIFLIFISLFIAIYIIRIMNNDPVVYINIQEGLIYKILKSF